MSDRQVPASWSNVPATWGMLNVGETHELYWRSFGRLDAMPVIALHGGPGSGSNPRHLTFFDPLLHRVVMFDQRGCGHSTSKAATVGNTTQNLLEDIERIRRHLRIERWLVFGVSWGAALALLYTQEHPGAALGLVMSGLSNRHDHQTSWILRKRARILPARHRAFLSVLTPRDHSDPIAALYRKSQSSHRNHQLEAAYAVWVLEAGLKGAEPEPLPTMTLDKIDASMVSRARIFLHYWANKSFLPQGHLLVNPTALTEIPVTLVHGASDWICPLSGAQQVAGELSAAQLIVVPREGHLSYGTGLAQALRESIAAMS